MYAKEEVEGKRLRNPFDTITEGIGIMMAKLNCAFQGMDKEDCTLALSPQCD